MTQISFLSNRFLIPLCASAFLLLGACSWFSSDTDADGNENAKPAYVEAPAEELYARAMEYLNDRNYEAAAEEFDEVERQHPASAWATQAQLMTGYALYEANKYDEALIALDKFIQLHPGNRDVAYAYYLKALSYYEQISDVARDQSMTLKAQMALQEVVDRFPDSKYAKDAKIKIDLTVDHMAGKEMSTGRYYQSQNQYLAAINRFKTVVDQYQTTTHIPEAMHRLIELYLTLGLKEEAAKTAAVLAHNYPGSEWYEDSYALMTTGANVPEKTDASSGWFGWLW